MLADNMDYEFFSIEQDPVLFICQETGEQGIDEIFVFNLDELRRRCGFPFIITSGFRSENHSIEAKKKKPGEHNRGAADIYCTNSMKRYTILKHAFDMGFSGIGIDGEFIHIDRRKSMPVCWVY